MRVQIESDRQLPSATKAWIEDKARLAFGPHSAEVRRIRIQLRKLESSEAVVTVLCRKVPTVVTGKTSADPLVAYSEAVEQASRQLKSRLRLKRALAKTEVG